MKLKNKYSGWALVTGASSGIGEAFARYLARQGIPVILVARRQDRLEALAQELTKLHGVDCHVIAQDLALPNALENVLSQLGNREVDILINNAGFGLHGRFHEQPESEIYTMTVLNVMVPVLFTRYFSARMVERKRGIVVFLASVVAYQGFPLIALYGATKGFDLLLGEALHAELKEHGVDVITVSPGTTATEFHDIAKMKSGSAMNKPRTAMQVVETAFARLGKQPSVVDGFKNWLAVISMNLVPRRFRPAILKNAMLGQALID